MKAATASINVLQFITTLFILSFLTFLVYSAEKNILNNMGKTDASKKSWIDKLKPQLL